MDKKAITRFGYSSLPLTIKFTKKLNVLDFDVNTHYILELLKTYVDERL